MGMGTVTVQAHQLEGVMVMVGTVAQAHLLLVGVMGMVGGTVAKAAVVKQLTKVPPTCLVGGLRRATVASVQI